MKDIKRYSPVEFKVTPLKTENRDHWDVVLEYHNEGDGPWLVDLCHRTRLDCRPGIWMPKTVRYHDPRHPRTVGAGKRVSDQPHEPDPEFHLSSGRGFR